MRVLLMIVINVFKEIMLGNEKMSVEEEKRIHLSSHILFHAMISLYITEMIMLIFMKMANTFLFNLECVNGK